MRTRKIKDLTKGILNKDEIDKVRNAFDVLGDIAIFSSFPDELKKKEKLIGNKILANLKHVKVVMKKIKNYSGKYRLPKFKVIAGEKRKETIHKENGVRIIVNPEKCYFSSRLSGERLRISKLVKPNETILVMFSGVGVYPIVISKNSKAKEIYGIEINPSCHKYGLENLKLNKISNVWLYLGDVFKVIKTLKLKFDRILMPLPKGAEDFLKLIKGRLKKNGIVHFYDFSLEDDIPSSSIKKIKKIFPEAEILNVVKCGNYAPRKYRLCVDFKI